RLVGQLGELGLPARPAGAVVRRLRTDQGRHQPHTCVVQFAPHDPYDIRGLPAPAPGRRHELLAAPGEFGVRRRVGGEQGRAGVEGGVGRVVEGRPEGAVDGAGRTHGPDRVTARTPFRCQPKVDTSGLSTYG